MNLSTIYATNLRAYYEYAWVDTASTSSFDQIEPKTNTVLRLTQKIHDTSDSQDGSLSSNSAIVPAGTYYFEANTTFIPRQKGSNVPSFDTFIFRTILILGLYNGSTLLSSKRHQLHPGLLDKGSFDNHPPKSVYDFNGYIQLLNQGSLNLRLFSNVQGRVGSNLSGRPSSGTPFTVPQWGGTDPNGVVDHKTNLKLYRLR